MSQSCDFCFRRCCLSEGQKGYCGARENIEGKIVSVNYGQLVSLALDPVEKKPLYHFLLHTKTLSVSESGCNYSCLFCQNWEISQKIVEEEETSPSSLAAYCLRYGVPSVSYTYSEPLVWQDYMLCAAEEAKKTGVRNIMVTNGSFSCEALERIVPLVDAFNVDLKGDDEFYKNICKASLQPVLDGIEYIVNHGRHIEVTTMLIEGMHDEKMVRMLGSLLRERGVRVWHLSRFFPRYRMKDRKETSEAFLSSMLTVAKESGIPYIYGGNTMIPAVTVCPHCGRVLRDDVPQMLPSSCPECGETVYGVFA